MPKYPIEVELTGSDGNAFALMGKVRTALQRGGVEEGQQDLFMEEFTACLYYDDLLNKLEEWVNVT